MQETGASYKFTIAERKVIKELIDKKYGRISTSIDYQSYGEYNSGVEGDIYTYTNKTISGSTLERLVGLRTKEDRGIRKTTLNIISKYLDFSSIDFFIKKIAYTIKNPNKIITLFELSQVFVKHFTRIEYGTNKEILLRHISLNKFEIIGTRNTKFLLLDIIELQQLEVDLELICRSVERVTKGKYVNLGLYHSSQNNLVRAIGFNK